VVNTVGFSRLLFVDRFVPAPACRLQRLRARVLQLIWCHGRTQVSYQRLIRPLALVGFGLRDLPTVLDGVDWVRRLFLFPDAHRVFVERRALIQEYILAIRPRARTYWDFRHCHRLRIWRWPLLAAFGWRRLLRGTRCPFERFDEALPYPWRAFFDAGIGASPSFRLRPMLSTSFSEEFNDMEAPLPVAWFVPDTSDPLLLCDDTRRRRDEAGPIMPRGCAHSLPCDDPARWRRWWKALSGVRAVSPDIANLAHLLALGSLHAADHFVFQEAAQP
jgi:hypothetical protein